MTQILVTNYLGTFILEDNKILDKILFKELAEYHNKKQIEQNEAQLLKKYPNAKKQAFFVFPQAREYIKKFWEVNIAVAKQACKDAVKKEHFIMQAVASIQDIEKAINPLVKRCREWYALHCPEVNEKIANHETFIELITTKKKQEILDELQVTITMGADIATVDLEPLENFGRQIKVLYSFKKQLEEYIEKALHDLAPNLLAVAGPLLAAELLLHAGSLEKLGKMPASTIQLLGAENALFLYLRNQGNCPRHGIIVKHPLLASAKNEYHGKVARKIAAVISIAARLDRFHGEQYKGYEMREKLEKNIAQLTAKPRKVRVRQQEKKETYSIKQHTHEKPRSHERKSPYQKHGSQNPKFQQKYRHQERQYNPQQRQSTHKQRSYTQLQKPNTHQERPHTQTYAFSKNKQYHDQKNKSSHNVGDKNKKQEKKRYPYQQMYNGPRTKQGVRR